MISICTKGKYHNLIRLKSIYENGHSKYERIQKVQWLIIGSKVHFPEGSHKEHSAQITTS